VCTLILAWQVFPDAPLAVAANRDELLDRPSEPPAVRDWEARTLAPVDREAAGTWMGYNEYGVFVAITNRWVDADLPGDRSRGLLVRDALAAASAEDAARVVERAVAADGYDGFNLVVADEAAAVYLEYDGALSVRNFEPGVHVVVNVGADGDYRIPATRTDPAEEQADNADRIRRTLAPDPGEDAESWLDRAATVIGDHEYGVCVHGDGFGTRSSTLLLAGDGRLDYRHAEGPPCRPPHEPVDGQL
jgi:uncharacterized protein with NRDE domain